MKLYATTTSERASKGQGGNEYIIIDLKVGSAKNSFSIGQVEVILNNDTKHGCNTDEWVLQWRSSEHDDWNILAQGNIDNTKGEKKKGEKCLHGYCNDERICNACGKQL